MVRSHNEIKKAIKMTAFFICLLIWETKIFSALDGGLVQNRLEGVARQGEERTNQHRREMTHQGPRSQGMQGKNFHTMRMDYLEWDKLE